jgi:hypothetical protein
MCHGHAWLERASILHAAAAVRSRIQSSLDHSFAYVLCILDCNYGEDPIFEFTVIRSRLVLLCATELLRVASRQKPQEHTAEQCIPLQNQYLIDKSMPKLAFQHIRIPS